MSINKIVNSNEILKKYYGFLLLIAVELFFIFAFFRRQAVFCCQ